jgi:hypothetical protein
MVQLKVYDGSDQYFLDLYEEETIKLNMSIEDITNAEAKSTFSRAFRVPATGNNNQFFKHAFMISGTDYDVTVKKTADILVNGADFRTGHIRLQKIYVNGDQDKVDYEILFMGETRDFSSALGDRSLCDLDLSALTHVLNGTNVETSWDAYPSGGATSGLVGGNVIYPLVDFGTTGTVTTFNPRISVSGPHNILTQDLPIERMKPMVRAKAIVDAIFASTDYEYETGGFFDSNLFRQLYVSGWGDVVSPNIDQSQSDNIFNAIGEGIQGSAEYLEAPVEISDIGNNYNNVTSTYTAPLSGVYGFRASCYYSAQAGTTGAPAARLQVYKNATIVATGATGWNQTITVNWSGSLVPGDTIRIYIEDVGVNDGEQVTDQTFRCLVAPGDINVAAQFDCDYKQIDFIKDLLTTFRLVMAPDKINPKKFIIEPWVEYIGKGDYYDWSDKLDRTKDLIIEPVFDTQTDIIYFDHTGDSDFINDYHVNSYKNVYGHLEFDSGNDLLKGSRNIKTGWAPTPMQQIEGAPDTSPFIIPQVHTFDQANAHLPIKPKTRWLFYNGKKTTGGYSWRLENGPTTPYSYYPMVSYSNGWPIINVSTILNWFNDIGYWGDNVSGYPPQGGSDMYEKYWSGYINSLYSKDARRVTATFILNDVDLQNFTFDDIIFVDGNYYRPEQIIDAPIGERAPVKVQMLKLLTGRFRV